MKNHQKIGVIILFALIILGTSCFSQVLSTFSGQVVDVQFSGKNFNKQSTDEIILSNLNKGNARIQPLLDKANSGAELLWKATGDLKNIYKEVDNTNSSWIWSQALPGKVSLRITLGLDGNGYIDLFQEGQLVGHIRCKSSAHRGGEGGQPNPGKTRVWRKSEHYVSSVGVKMPNSLFIDKPGRMLAIHAGNKVTDSGGCVRVGIFASAQLYRLMPEGGEVEVILR